MFAFVSVIAVSFFEWLRWRRLAPVEWQKVGTVEKLFIFPLKSGKPKRIQSATFEKLGLVEDVKDRDGVTVAQVQDRCFIPVKVLSQSLTVGGKRVSNSQIIALRC